ncbi:MAG: Gfo/Idh/MocA family oxidoreductase [Pseudomonadota bacterium]
MKAALIGLGMVSRTYGEAFRASKLVSLHTAHAPSLESQERFLCAFPDVCDRIAPNVQHIADDPEVDFAIVTTPPNARQEIVEVLAAAGKPILMEKPVERTLAAANDLVDLCEELNVPLGVVLQHRARPIVRSLREKMNMLGALVAVEVAVPWWRPQSYYDEPGRGTYARDGGGVLISQAIHTLDLVLSLTGPVSDVTSMSATTAFHSMEAEDFMSAGLGFANGAVGHLFATTASFPGTGETITLHCQHGSARLAAGGLRIDYQDGRSEEVGTAASSGAGADPMAFTSDWHQAMIEDFGEAVASGRAPMVTGRDALEVHRLITALEESGRSGNRVTLRKVASCR